MINRIETLKKYYGLSTRALAVKCGINQPTLDRMLKGINALNLNCVTSILTTFPEISADWLMRGEGEMLNTPATDPNTDRINSLIDTIATLQEAINTKSETITALSDRIKQLEALIKK